jgi:hypothetical protein
MVVATLVLTGLVILGSWCFLLALVGRSTYPRRERRPLRAWRWADLRANALRGLSEMSSFGAAPVR